MAKEFGVVGLGKIGGGLARLALDKGMRVVGSSRGGAPRELVDAGLMEIKEPADFRHELHAHA